MTEAQIESPQAQNLVTSENLQEFQFKRMGIEIPTFTEKTETDTGDGDAEEIVAKAVQDEEIHEEDHEEDEEKIEKPKVPSDKSKADRLLRQRNKAREEATQAKAEREALSARLAALEAKQVANTHVTEAPVVNANEKPDKTKYTDAFQYAEDLARWSARQERIEMQQEIQKKEQAEAQMKQAKTWTDKIKKFEAELHDYDDVLNASTAQVKNVVRDAMMESDYGPKLFYHLAQNEELAEKLMNISDMQALKEIGKLEAKFEAEVEGKTEKKPQMIKSKAPAPISPIKGGKSPEDISDGDGLDFRKYRELRKAGKIR